MLCCSDFRGADRARACPGPGKRLSHCPANLGPTGTPPPRGQLDGWMDGWTDAWMGRQEEGCCGANLALAIPVSTLLAWRRCTRFGGENIVWLFGTLISVRGTER